MKALKTIVFLSVFACGTISHAQVSQTPVSQRAILFADSLVSAYQHQNWNAYLNISYPGLIKYYGGKQGFSEFVKRSSHISQSNSTTNRVELIQLENISGNEWQSVIRKYAQTFIDNKKATIISYLVGQSTDKGNTWTYFDVAHNSIDQLAYIMPDISSNLTIPQRKVIFERDQIVKQQ